MTYLQRLVAGDPDTWGEAYRCLYPVAFESARLRLVNSLPMECEDVAVESLAELPEKVSQLTSDFELKPLVAAIARNKATDRLRRHLSLKRGGSKLQSLDAMLQAGEGSNEVGFAEDLLGSLSVQELRGLLEELANELKKEYRIVLREHFFEQLSHKEIAQKHGIAIGSVGVYVQRGLGALRNILAKRPQIKSELVSILADASVVRLLLPLASVVQFGGWFFDHMRRYQHAGEGIMPTTGGENPSRNEERDSAAAQLERLRAAHEPGSAAKLGETPRSALLAKAEQKFPESFQHWRLSIEQERRRVAKMHLDAEVAAKRGRLIFLFLLLAGMAALIFAIFHN